MKFPARKGSPERIVLTNTSAASLVMTSHISPKNRGIAVCTRKNMKTVSTAPRKICGNRITGYEMPLTDIAWTSLSDAKRCVTIVAANPAENGSAYCNIGTIARKIYLRIPPGPKRFPVNGLMTAPKATTTTMITVVSSKTLLNSERKWRKRIQGMKARFRL